MILNKCVVTSVVSWWSIRSSLKCTSPPPRTSYASQKRRIFSSWESLSEQCPEIYSRFLKPTYRHPLQSGPATTQSPNWSSKMPIWLEPTLRLACHFPPSVATNPLFSPCRHWHTSWGWNSQGWQPLWNSKLLFNYVECELLEPDEYLFFNLFLLKFLNNSLLHHVLQIGWSLDAIDHYGLAVDREYRVGPHQHDDILRSIPNLLVDDALQVVYLTLLLLIAHNLHQPPAWFDVVLEDVQVAFHNVLLLWWW